MSKDLINLIPLFPTKKIDLLLRAIKSNDILKVQDAFERIDTPDNNLNNNEYSLLLTAAVNFNCSDKVFECLYSNILKRTTTNIDDDVNNKLTLAFTALFNEHGKCDISKSKQYLTEIACLSNYSTPEEINKLDPSNYNRFILNCCEYHIDSSSEIYPACLDAYVNFLRFERSMNKPTTTVGIEEKTPFKGM